MQKLIGAKYFQFDLATYKESPELLEHKKEVLLADYICSIGDDYTGWTDLRKKNFIAQNSEEIPALYFEIERVQKQLASEKNVNMTALSDSLICCLTTPHQRIDPEYFNVLKNLISEIDPSDPVRLFKYNKHRFYREYISYSECKKKWLVDYLNRRI